jgi:sarcosine/dimethylglycine N-methyltransferase
LCRHGSTNCTQIRWSQASPKRGPPASADLIWCRDVLEHVQDLEAAFAEFRRVLRPGGHAVIYQMTATDWLTPAEAARLWPPGGIYASSVDPRHFESAIAAAGLTIAQGIQLQPAGTGLGGGSG